MSTGVSSGWARLSCSAWSCWWPATSSVSVAASPTLISVAILAAVVFIRTFLSFSLEVETTGRWPWQKREIIAS
jgi:hypothetical protein